MDTNMAANSFKSCNFNNVEHREMILYVLGSRNSTKYITITQGVSEWVNLKWLPRWQPKSINDHNFCSVADSYNNESSDKI